METEESIAEWKVRVVREACERNGVPVTRIFKKKKTIQAVSRVRAQAVRILVGVGRMTLREAGRAVGMTDHSSVTYWITGRGKDRYK